MSKKIISFLILTVMAIASLFAASACGNMSGGKSMAESVTQSTETADSSSYSSYSDEYFTYTYLSETDSYEIQAKDVNNMPAEVVLPSTLEGKPVTSIGYMAFYNCSSLTSIELPSSVTSIGRSAFSWCSSLTNITFGENSRLTSIGGEAFDHCWGLTSIEIPSSVTSIGDRAFEDCYSLTIIEIPSSVTSIGDYAFAGCSSLTSVKV